MLKRTLVIFILAACGVMSLQTTEAASSNSDTYLTGCCGKKKKHFCPTSEKALASCKKCKNKRVA